MSTVAAYQINGIPVSVERYAQVCTDLLADAFDFRRRVQAWHESVGKVDENQLDPFRMWVQVDDLLRGHAMVYTPDPRGAHVGGCNKRCNAEGHYLRGDA